jgi:hypothetical protein
MRLIWEALTAFFGWILEAPSRLIHWIAGLPRLVDWFGEGDNRSEAWGYFWWGAVAIVIGIPEIWAAVGGKDVLWPTISGTVGNLEVSNVWVAFIVVAVLVWAGFHAVRVAKDELRAKVAGHPDRLPEVTAQMRQRGSTASTSRRGSFSTQDTEALTYLVIAVFAVAVPSALVKSLYEGDDRRYVFGEALYASIAFWWLIVPGWLAYKRASRVPYPTLFTSLKTLAGRAPKFTVLLTSALLVLLVHLILYPWPSTIPDTNRLHLQFKCHPLKTPKKELDSDEKAACQKLDDANLKPPLSAPR